MPMGGRKGAKTCHTECSDGAAQLGSASSPGERCPAVLPAVPAGKLGEQRKEVVSASQPPWSCALSSGSAVPKELRVEFEGVIESIQSHMAALFFLAKAAKD